MDPNKKFKNRSVISAANLPKHLQTRDPEEYRMEMKEMLAEMGFCPKCHDHKPCGCGLIGKCPNCLTEYFDLHERVCYACDYDEMQDPNTDLILDIHV